MENENGKRDYMDGSLMGLTGTLQEEREARERREAAANRRREHRAELHNALEQWNEDIEWLQLELTRAKEHRDNILLELDQPHST